MASDPEGMALELEDVTDGGRETVADVHRADDGGAMRFSAYRRDLPVAVVRWRLA